MSDVSADERAIRTGESEPVHGRERLVCDMVFEEAWRGSLAARHLPPQKQGSAGMRGRGADFAPPMQG
ncbi:MAG: hypothetical protein JNM82_14315 [Rhodocyclaceae bacterium]|nr:hypothetical protein [Rhodocyclaceae bacterium]